MKLSDDVIRSLAEPTGNPGEPGSPSFPGFPCREKKKRGVKLNFFSHSKLNFSQLLCHGCRQHGSATTLNACSTGTAANMRTPNFIK